MNQAEVMDLLSDREGSLKEVAVKKIATQFEGRTRLLVVNDEHHVSDKHLFNQFCSHLSVPPTFLRRTDPELGTQVVDYLAKKLNNIHVLVHDAKPVRVYNKKLPYTPPTKVFGDVLKRFGHFDYFEVDQSPDCVQLAFRSAKIQAEPQKGDVVKGGVNFRFSEFGIVSPEIETASYRLACTNGMIHPDFLQRIQVTAKTYDAMIERINSNIDSALKIFDEVIAPKMSKSATTAIDPMQAIRRLAQENALRTSELDRVMAAYAAEPMPTMWGVSNAFTRAASEFNFATRTHLQTIGGTVVRTSNVPHCTACAAKL